MKKWQSLVCGLCLGFVIILLMLIMLLKQHILTEATWKSRTLMRAAKESFLLGIDWFHNANILLDEGKEGVLEGFHHDIDAKVCRSCRYRKGGLCRKPQELFVHHMLTGDVKSLEIANNLEDYCYNNMQIKGRYVQRHDKVDRGCLGCMLSG